MNELNAFVYIANNIKYNDKDNGRNIFIMKVISNETRVHTNDNSM